MNVSQNEWKYLKDNFSCGPKQCVHTYPTRVSPGTFNTEMSLYNDVQAGKRNAKCTPMDDYRLTY